MRKKYFFEIKTHFSYFNVLGIGSSLRKRQRQIIRLSKLSWKWSVGIWHHHLVQQGLKNCSLTEGWWQPTADLPYQEKSWTRFSFCEKTHWWQTLILAGYKKTFICIWTTKTINVWSIKYNINPFCFVLDFGRWIWKAKQSLAKRPA